jgi:phosphatidate cytidylyltransferase
MLMQLRMTGSVAFLVYVIAMVKFTDIGAYFTGSFLGKHKMILWLSPGKTWEGLAGGLLTAAGVGVAGYYLASAYDFDLFVNSPVTAAFMGLTLGIVGQFGDLCESLFKRAAGVKDSGALIPQFGGVLDLLDSPLIAAPVAYLWLILLKY